jgi:hypothetical protein
VPDQRGEKLAHKLADEVVNIARQLSCDTLMTQVDLEANGVEHSLKTIINYGFTIYKDGGFSRLVNFIKRI